MLEDIRPLTDVETGDCFACFLFGLFGGVIISLSLRTFIYLPFWVYIFVGLICFLVSIPIINFSVRKKKGVEANVQANLRTAFSLGFCLFFSLLSTVLSLFK